MSLKTNKERGAQFFDCEDSTGGRLTGWADVSPPSRQMGWNSTSLEGINAPKEATGLIREDISARHMRRLIQRMRHAVSLMSESVEIEPRKRASVPVLRGTRFKVSQLLAQMLDGDMSAKEVADEFDLEFETVKKFLEALSIAFDFPKDDSATKHRVRST